MDSGHAPTMMSPIDRVAQTTALPIRAWMDSEGILVNDGAQHGDALGGP